ncbi:MAG TPA: FAD-binding oxidoreductase [Leptolyngbyaceae cyanobacterium]
MTRTEEILTDLPGNPLAGLRRADELWFQYRQGTIPVSAAVQAHEVGLETVDWDVVICGGTLGILLGVALAQRGWRVALLERGQLKGRDQEWNISRRELAELTELGLLSEAELEGAIATEYNPARIQFGDGQPLWVRDVLNVGVDPVYLLETLKQTFLNSGGCLFEQTGFEAAHVHPNGVQVKAGAQSFTTRLLIDAMGHFSPIVRQAREGRKPEAACLAVGTCAEGYAQNDSGDLIVSFTPIRNQCQYFWEAFPARDGRTTYLFTYLDAECDRISLETLFEEYWTLLPQYQNTPLTSLTVKRALFGFFPCYRNSPLTYPWGRLLPIGDASGSQSPLSFGGFGALIRHLPRLTYGIHEALQQDCLEAAALSWLQPYQPNLSVTWLFQKSMSVGLSQKLPEQQINQMLSAIFADMAELGNPTLRPFLQDVVQFPALTKTLATTAIKHPDLVAKIIPQVGLVSLLDWMRHYANLATYSALHPLLQFASPLLKSLSGSQQYYGRRWLDALRYGTGNDYIQ